MSIEKLLSALRRETDLKEIALLKEAEEKAHSILASARENADEIDSQKEKLEKELTAKRESVRLAKERMHARKMVILAQDRTISDVLAECRTMAAHFMETPAYADFLTKEYKRIKGEVGAIETVIANEKTAAIFNLGDLHLSQVVLDEAVKDGFVAVAEKGRTKVLCLFHLLAEKAWNDAAPRFVKKIVEAVENVGYE